MVLSHRLLICKGFISSLKLLLSFIKHGTKLILKSVRICQMICCFA